MIMNYRIQNILLLFGLFFFLQNNNPLLSQVGLSHNLFKYSDSTKVKNNVKWKSLQELNNFNQFELSLKYYNNNYNFNNNRYHPINVMPKDPLKIDYRSGSYYVPRIVKDELNLIMNRPKDNSFVPILGVAFIAAQLASKYLFVQNMIKINNENILNSIDNFEILNELWKQKPQTATQLYLLPKIYNKYTLKVLLKNIEILIENKLVKQKNVEDAELLYFPSISKTEFDQYLKKLSTDSTITRTNRDKIKKIIGY